MSDIAIKAEQLSKYYRLGVINNGTLFRDIQSWIARKRGKIDPHSKIGDKYDGTIEGFWALKDLNFEIKQGDRVGIIGKNGAGKSTLLKILSRITAPTEGQVKIRGRVASLLEVGTGFHGELTGRENIYLNGAILGMKKKEVDRKLDEIIDFSGIEKHIDTPVKRYSSGMYVRLAFAVAAHLDSEILIADEVLAVGDAEFQKKALGKMNELSSGQGRTVLFVSHNMTAVKSLCNRGMILEKGELKFTSDNIDETIGKYQNLNVIKLSDSYVWNNIHNIKNDFITINNIKITNDSSSNIPEKIIIQGKTYFLKFNLSIKEKNPLLTLYYIIYNEYGIKVIESAFSDSGKDIGECLKEGENIVIAELPTKELMPGKYRIEVLSSIKNISYIIDYDTIEIPIEIDADEQKFPMYKNRNTVLYTKENWSIV
ncbi:ABC transporter ATP-binding protein [Treponema sp. HNW]|uniref:ABC transporter ATP-binding protein n=1 Tax=Treponema sp. HNW TaxID=3116654 RepID=UPI003D0E59B9